MNNNISLLNTLSQQKLNETNIKIATGQKINSAKDDAAGLAIAENIHSQINGLEVASRNSTDGINMLNTAEGSLDVVTDSLQRVRELSLQASNGVLNDDQRGIISNEINELLAGVNDIVGNTEFNNRNLLDGSLDASNGGVNLQVGSNSGQQTNFSIENMDVSSLGLGPVDFSNSDYSQISDFVDLVDSALDTVGSTRSEIGAMQNTLDYTINSTDTANINLQESKSRIMDSDIAKQTMDNSIAKALQNVQYTMQAQSMQNSVSVLQLLS